MGITPANGKNTLVIVNCAPFSHFGGYPADAGELDGWTYDYSVSPPDLVFGAAACAQLQQLGRVDVTIAIGCNYIC